MLKRKQKTGDRSSGREVSEAAVSFRRIACAAALGLGVLLIVLMLSALMISWGFVSAHSMYLCMMIAVFCAGLCSALAAGGSRKRLLSALLACALLLAVLLAAGAALFGGAFAAKNFLLVLIILLISCMIGSVISTAIR